MNDLSYRVACRAYSFLDWYMEEGAGYLYAAVFGVALAALMPY